MSCTNGIKERKYIVIERRWRNWTFIKEESEVEKGVVIDKVVTERRKGSE